MRADALVFAVAGTLFGLLVGWMLGSQQAPSSVPAQAPPAAVAQSTPGEPAAQPPATIDEGRVNELRSRADQNPNDAAPRIELGNVYFDAERYADAITWYEAALTLDPSNADVSTDLGVAYYYTNQPDRAISQFQMSLQNNPTHTKTLLNLGIVQAFGKQDLTAAAESWRKVVELAPDSPEGQAAKKALDGLEAAHAPGGPPPSGGQ